MLPLIGGHGNVSPSDLTLLWKRGPQRIWAESQLIQHQLDLGLLSSRGHKVDK